MDEKIGNGAAKPQRKMKFMPKAPRRREQKLMLPKPEKTEDAEPDDEKAQELLKRFTEASNRPKFKQETKPLQTRVSSFNFGPSRGSSSMRSYPTPKPGGGDAAASGMATMKEYKEPWDYYKDYPVTLPVRMPYSGNPELLDEQEFKEDSETMAHNVDSANPAKELSLMEEDTEKKLIFIQLPPTMPLPKQSVKTEGKEMASSSKPSEDTSSSSKGCSLNELPTGLMGKMLVYKSGAVKLKLGDHLYNVYGGQDCNFPQDVVAMNTEEKHCCNVGEISKRAIITPDIDSVLESLANSR